jgi:UDP-2-acetamido-2,6-beta-L-arabino-hexul-4-ose reductase
MNLLITGATGFIGKNLINKLSVLKKYNLFFLSRYNSEIFPYRPEVIDKVIHLSCVHRDNPEELVYKKNYKIDNHLIDTLNKYNLTSDILFTSSIHETKDTFYAKSKRDSTKFLKKVCDDWNREFIKLTFPNIFGPYAKPNHTSVVANFCNNIVLNKESFINDVNFEMIYIDQAIKSILEFKSKEKFETQKINLFDLYIKIQSLYDSYKKDRRVELKSNLDIQLFYTLKSYINE